MKLNKWKIMFMISGIAVLIAVTEVNLQPNMPESAEMQSQVDASQAQSVAASDELIIECPGIEFISTSFEGWVVDYRATNPEATIAEEQAAWDKLLAAMNCEEFTTDNIRNTIRALPTSTISNE